MRIILNSDVLHTQKLLADGLPKHISSFCAEVVGAGASLILPETVKHELERSQGEIHKLRVIELENAAKLLRNRGVAVGEFKVESAIPAQDLVSILRETSVPVDVERATLEDYREAERRASLHLPPLSGNEKSDEMRDLIIWVIALRIAKAERGAVLISRDSTHSGDAGSVEADECQLVRAKDLEEGVEFVGKRSPALQLARKVFETVMPAILEEGVPIPRELPWRRFSRLKFDVGEEGRANMTVHFDFAAEGGGRIEGQASIHQDSTGTISLHLCEFRDQDGQWGAGFIRRTVEGELPKYTRPYEDRMTDMKKLTEE